VLVAAMIARADEVHAEQQPGMPAKYLLTGLSHSSAQERLLADAGMVPERWNFVMRAARPGATPDEGPATGPGRPRAASLRQVLL